MVEENTPQNTDSSNADKQSGEKVIQASPSSPQNSKKPTAFNRFSKIFLKILKHIILITISCILSLILFQVFIWYKIFTFNNFLGDYSDFFSYVVFLSIAFPIIITITLILYSPIYFLLNRVLFYWQ